MLNTLYPFVDMRNVRMNLPLFSTVVPAIILAGTTVENKGKLILTKTCSNIYVQKYELKQRK